MRKIIILTITCIALGFSVSNCKKDNTGDDNKGPFKADSAMVEIDDSLFYSYKDNVGNPRRPESMVFDSVHNALYVYLEGTNGKGFEIVGYNVANGSNASVYTNPDNTWANSNGSEGRNLYIRGNELWVPGGATNQKVQRLDIGNFTMTLAQEFDFDNVMFGDKEGYTPYDMTEVNGLLYIVSMNDYVFYADYPNLLSGKGNFTTSGTSHGSGIKAVTDGGTAYLAVKCGSANKIELRTAGGTFVRSVPLNGSNYSQMLKDSKNRLYYADDSNKKIVRYSADLLTKEEFPVLDIYSFSGLALKEESDHVTVFCSYGNGIGMVRLPN